MSNFYYCNDCMQTVDLVFRILRHPHDPSNPEMAKEVRGCKECGGTNWHTEIDKGTHYEQVRESKIHPGSTHRVGDIEKLKK